MSEQRLLDALGQVDDQFITEAAPGQREIKPAHWKKWLSRAACLAVVIGIAWFAWSRGMPIPGLPRRFQSISYDSQSLCEKLEEHISDDTKVINTVDKVFPAKIPMYKITKHTISQQDYQQMVNQLNIPSNPEDLELYGNHLFYNLANHTDSSRGFFEMTDEELEILAWDVFNKIPFLEGEYEYGGITGGMRLYDSEGWHVTRARVTFYQVLNGVRISGEDDCSFWFDGSGLVQISIALFDYEETGTLRLVPLESASKRITKPDSFSFGFEDGIAKTLEVEKVTLHWVNQYSKGCTILQPIYNFTGTATLGDGRQTDFSSKVIAVPSVYTYKKWFD